MSEPITPTVEEEVALVRIEGLNSLQVFTGGGMNAILDQIEQTVRGITLDVSTPTGRDQIRSVAYRVARTKTALDAEGKRLTEEWRKNTAQVNAERKKSTERLDALAADVRRPLTEFENKDKARVQAHEEALVELRGILTLIGPGGLLEKADAKTLAEHFQDYRKVHADRQWEEFAERAKRIRSEVVLRFVEKIESRIKFEADQAELEMLRRQQVEREQRERDAKLKAEAAEASRLLAERLAAEAAAAEKQRVEAEAARVRLEHENELKAAEAERQRIQDEAERERKAAESRELEAQERQRTEERARDRAENAAAEEKRLRLEAEERSERERKRAIADLAAMQKKAEADRIEAAEAAAQQAERNRIEAEESRKAHLAELQAKADKLVSSLSATKLSAARREILEDLEQFLLPQGDGEKIADAIIAGKIRHVKAVL